MHMLTMIGDGELSDNPLALLMPKVEYEGLQLQPEVMRKYRPTTITNLSVVRSHNESTRGPDVIMLQCGKPTVTYQDTTIIYTLPGGTLNEKLSAQIASDDIPAELFKKLENNPMTTYLKQ